MNAVTSLESSRGLRRQLGVVAVVAAFACVVAGCGDTTSISKSEQARRCAPLGFRIGSDECAQEAQRQVQDERCLESGDEACMSEGTEASRPATTTAIAANVAKQVAEQFGGELDSIDCGKPRRIEAGDSVNCAVTAQGGSGTITATVNALGPPIEVTVDVADPGTTTDSSQVVVDQTYSPSTGDGSLTSGGAAPSTEPPAQTTETSPPTQQSEYVDDCRASGRLEDSCQAEWNSRHPHPGKTGQPRVDGNPRLETNP